MESNDGGVSISQEHQPKFPILQEYVSSHTEDSDSIRNVNLLMAMSGLYDRVPSWMCLRSLPVIPGP